MKGSGFTGCDFRRFFSDDRWKRRPDFGNGDADSHSAVGFVRAVVFIRPPDARADALTGRDDKMLAQIVASPGDAAAPGRIFISTGLPS